MVVWWTSPCPGESGRGGGKYNSRCPFTQESWFSCCRIQESSAEACSSILSPQPGHRILTGSSGTSFPRCQGEVKCFVTTAGQWVPHPDALGALGHATALAASGLSLCPCFPTHVAFLLQLLLSFSDPSFICPRSIFLHYKWILPAGPSEEPPSASSTALVSATSILLLPLISFHLPHPCQASPHLLNPSFPVLLRCCQPTQKKAGRSTALPRIARDVVYAQWWHLNRRCARVMPGQSSWDNY